MIQVDGSGIVRRNGRRQHRDGNEEHQEQDANDSEGLVAKSASEGHRWPMIAYCCARVDTMRDNAMGKQLCMIALAATMLAMPAWAQQAVEQQVMDLANADRAQQGLAPLKWDPALAQAAADHAQLMAQQPALSHQYPGEPTWSPGVARRVRISARSRKTSPWRRARRRSKRSG